MNIFTRYLRFVLSLILLCAGLSAVYADRPSHHDRDKWFGEMRQVKYDFIIKELDVTEEQKARFMTVYEQMEQETYNINQQTRALLDEVYKKGDKASELECEKAAEASYELKSKEGEIEMRYYKELKKILSPRQMLRLRKAERKFTRELMKHQPRHRKN